MAGRRNRGKKASPEQFRDEQQEFRDAVFDNLFRQFERERPRFHGSLAESWHEAEAEPEDCCSICLEPYFLLRPSRTRPREQLTALPCGHQFHTGCLGDWVCRGLRKPGSSSAELAGNPYCPDCCQDIPNLSLCKLTEAVQSAMRAIPGKVCGCGACRQPLYSEKIMMGEADPDQRNLVKLVCVHRLHVTCALQVKAGEGHGSGCILVPSRQEQRQVPPKVPVCVCPSCHRHTPMRELVYLVSGGQAQCPICLGDLRTGGPEPDARVMVFPDCGHACHYSCGMQWYERSERNPACPICRQPAPSRKNMTVQSFFESRLPPLGVALDDAFEASHVVVENHGRLELTLPGDGPEPGQISKEGNDCPGEGAAGSVLDELGALLRESETFVPVPELGTNGTARMLREVGSDSHVPTATTAPAVSTPPAPLDSGASASGRGTQRDAQSEHFRRVSQAATDSFNRIASQAGPKSKSKNRSGRWQNEHFHRASQAATDSFLFQEAAAANERDRKARMERASAALFAQIKRVATAVIGLTAGKLLRSEPSSSDGDKAEAESLTSAVLEIPLHSGSEALYVVALRDEHSIGVVMLYGVRCVDAGSMDRPLEQALLEHPENVPRRCADVMEEWYNKAIAQGCWDQILRGGGKGERVREEDGVRPHPTPKSTARRRRIRDDRRTGGKLSMEKSVELEVNFTKLIKAQKAQIFAEMIHFPHISDLTQPYRELLDPRAQLAGILRMNPAQPIPEKPRTLHLGMGSVWGHSCWWLAHNILGRAVWERDVDASPDLLLADLEDFVFHQLVILQRENARGEVPFAMAGGREPDEVRKEYRARASKPGTDEATAAWDGSDSDPVLAHLERTLVRDAGAVRRDVIFSRRWRGSARRFTGEKTEEALGESHSVASLFEHLRSVFDTTDPVSLLTARQMSRLVETDPAVMRFGDWAIDERQKGGNEHVYAGLLPALFSMPARTWDIMDALDTDSECEMPPPNTRTEIQITLEGLVADASVLCERSLPASAPKVRTLRAEIQSIREVADASGSPEQPRG